MTRRRQLAVAVAVAVLLTVLPYGALLGHVPWGPDSVKWLDRGSLAYPQWFDWLVGRRHFIGYRPVAAATFLLNWLTTGHTPWAYRLTDLMLHLVSLVALFDLYRVMTRDRGLWGLLAMILLAAHPATEEVVPFVSRRSYLLGAVFGLLALSSQIRGLRSRGRVRWAWFGSVATCVALAGLSNEGAFVVVPLLPLIAVHETWGQPLAPRIRAVATSTGPALVATALVLARRVAVLGSLTGGYHKRFYAFMKKDVPQWRELPEWRPDLIAASCVEYVVSPQGVNGGRPLWAPLGELGPDLVAALLVVLAVLRPIGWLRGSDPARAERARLLWGLTLWALGALAIVVLSQTWFWRQGYFLLPPLGLMVALLCHDTWEHGRDARGWRAWTSWWPMSSAVVILAALWTGPVVGGLHLGAHGARVAHGPLARQAMALAREVPADRTVYLVVPAPTGATHMVRLWGNRIGQARSVRFENLANAAPGADLDAIGAVFTGTRSASRLRLIGGEEAWLRRFAGNVRPSPDGLVLRRLAGEEPVVVAILSRSGPPEWRRVPPRPSPSPAPDRGPEDAPR